MSNFALYMIGVILIVAALSYALVMLDVSTPWIVIGALVLIGLGVMAGVVKTRGG